MRHIPHEIYFGVVGAGPPSVLTAIGARVGSPITNSTGSTPEAGGRVYAQDYYLPSDVTGFFVRIGNRNNTSGVAAFASTVSCYASDGTGKPTGSAFATFSLTVPGDGTIAQVGPFFGSRGSDGKVVVLFGVPQGTTIAIVGGVQFGYYVTGTTTTSPNPGGWAANPGPNACVHVDFQTSRRRLVVLGDSISVGYSASTPVGFENVAFNLIATTKDWSVDVEGIVQFGALATFGLPATYPYLWDEEKWSGNPDLLINLGTNDIPNQSLSGMQTAIQAIITKYNTLARGKIFASTIPPQAAYADAGNVRTGYNSWLLANYASLGITAVRDRAAKQNVGGLADNSTGTTLFASYDSGDGTHLSIAGNVQEQTGWQAIL